MDTCRLHALIRPVVISTLLGAPLVSQGQSQWGFSVASTEYYRADSTHSEYVFFSKVVDITTLDCSKVNARTISGEEREKTKVWSECLNKWFFARLKEVKNEAVRNISTERALISQVEKMYQKGKECLDYDIPCLFQSKEEAEKERRLFMKRARKLKAVIFEVE